MFEKLEQAIGYTFRDKSLLKLAMTHPSYAGETHVHNQRLEFLGDAVLQLCTSVRLYKQYPDLPEGKLSRLRARCVQESALEVAARRLHLGENLLLGIGEERGGGREKPSILADAMEALLGADTPGGQWEEALTPEGREVRPLLVYRAGGRPWAMFPEYLFVCLEDGRVTEARLVAD